MKRTVYIQAYTWDKDSLVASFEEDNKHAITIDSVQIDISCLIVPDDDTWKAMVKKNEAQNDLNVAEEEVNLLRSKLTEACEALKDLQGLEHKS